MRAIAVIGVVLYHAGIGFPGGYAGVDVFFVISGFLITNIILRDLNRDNFSMFDFWERRARRILPALAVVVAFCLFAGFFLLLPNDFSSLGSHVMALAGFASNFIFWKETGYFQEAADQKPLLHTWSLSLEEQFYLLIPILLATLFRRGKSKWVFPILLVLGLASLTLSIAGTYRAPSATFFLLPFRAWELAGGALLAFAKPVFSARKRSAMSWLGLFAIIIPFLTYTNDTPFPGLAAVPPVAGTMLLIWAGIDQRDYPVSSVHRFLRASPMVWIGLLSYSLYLWHWPLLAFHRYLGIFENSISVRSGLVILSLILAKLSLHYVEQPFRNRSLVRSRRGVFTLSIVAVIVLVAPAVYIWSFGGLPGRISSNAQTLADGINDSSFRTEVEIEDIPKRLVKFGKLGNPPTVFVWGDSHAKAILPSIDAACKTLELSGVAANRAATAPVLDWYNVDRFGLGSAAPLFGRAVLNYLEGNEAKSSIRYVILAARWSRDIESEPEQFKSALLTTILAIQRSGYQVAILEEVPNWNSEVPKAAAFHEMFGWDVFRPKLELDELSLTDRKKALRSNELLNLANPVHFIDPVPFLRGPDGQILAVAKGFSLFRDKHHLTTHGALRIEPAFLQFFTNIAPPSP